MRSQLPQRRMPLSVFQLHAPQFEHRAGMWTTVEAIFLVSVSISLFARASATVFTNASMKGSAWDNAISPLPKLDTMKPRKALQ
jgi:hypothetical protein